MFLSFSYSFFFIFYFIFAISFFFSSITVLSDFIFRIDPSRSYFIDAIVDCNACLLNSNCYRADCYSKYLFLIIWEEFWKAIRSFCLNDNGTLLSYYPKWACLIKSAKEDTLGWFSFILDSWNQSKEPVEFIVSRFKKKYYGL